ncbi:MAG: hypothetical protein U0414_34910 [Polyangiaceae bacterium]
MTDERVAIGWDVRFDAKGVIADHLALLEPLLRAWCGGDPASWIRWYEGACIGWCYRPSDDFFVAVEHNSAYGKSPHASDRFPYGVGCVDLHRRLSPDVHRARVLATLELLWSHGIPTCCTSDWTEELPYAGGEDGPIPWPT